MHPASDDCRVIKPKVGIISPTKGKTIASDEVDGSHEQEDINSLEATSPVLRHTRKRKRSVKTQDHHSRHVNESPRNGDAVTSDVELPQGSMDGTIKSAIAMHAAIQANIRKRLWLNGQYDATLDAGDSTDPGDGTDPGDTTSCSTDQATSLSLLEEAKDEDDFIPTRVHISGKAADSPATSNSQPVADADSEEDQEKPHTTWRSRYPQLPASDSESD